MARGLSAGLDGCLLAILAALSYDTFSTLACIWSVMFVSSEDSSFTV